MQTGYWGAKGEGEGNRAIAKIIAIFPFSFFRLPKAVMQRRIQLVW